MKAEQSLRALILCGMIIAAALSASPSFSLEEKEKIAPTFAIFFLYPTGRTATAPTTAGFYKVSVPVRIEGVPEAQILIKRDTFETTVVPPGAVTAVASRVTFDDMVLNITGAREGKIKVHIWAYASTFDDRKAIYDREITVKCDPDGSEAVVVPADLKTPPKIYPEYSAAHKVIYLKESSRPERKMLFPAQDTPTVHKTIMDYMRKKTELSDKNIVPGALRVIMEYPSGPTADPDNAPGSYSIAFTAAQADMPEVVLSVDRNSRAVTASAPGAVCSYMYMGERDELVADIFGVLAGAGREISINIFRESSGTGQTDYSRTLNATISEDKIFEIRVPHDFKSDLKTGDADFSSLDYAGADILVSLGLEILKPEDLAKPDWLLKHRDEFGTVVGLAWGESAENRPEARIKGPRTARAGDTVSLDASDSKAAFPEFFWRQTAGAPAAVTNLSSPIISFTPSEPGLFSFLLEVKTNENTDYASFDINVTGSIDIKTEPVDSLPLETPSSRFFLLGKLLVLPVLPFNEVHTYDISDPLHPVFNKKYKLPATVENSAAIDSLMFGNVLFMLYGSSDKPTQNNPEAVLPHSHVSAFRLTPDEKLELLGFMDINQQSTCFVGTRDAAFLLTLDSLHRFDLSSPFSIDNHTEFPLPYKEKPPAGKIKWGKIFAFPFNPELIYVNDEGYLAPPHESPYFQLKNNLMAAVPIPALLNDSSVIGLWEADGSRYLMTGSGENTPVMQIIETDSPAAAKKRGVSAIPGNNVENFGRNIAKARIFGSLAVVWWPLGKQGLPSDTRFAVFNVFDPDKPTFISSFDIKGDITADVIYSNKALYVLIGNFIHVYKIAAE